MMTTAKAALPPDAVFSFIVTRATSGFFQSDATGLITLRDIV
jgi:hypothetical protein